MLTTWGNSTGTPGPSLELNFVGQSIAGALDPRITFSRASTATRVNSAGLIETVATNAPRFDYDPVTKQPKGLLIEEQRTNLLTYSEQFDNAAWTKTNVAITADTIIAPDGTQTGDKLYSTGGSVQHYLGQVFATTSGTSYSFSVYIKKSELQFVQLTLGSNGFNVPYCNFDLVNGVIGTQTNCTATIQSVGNGWYRCSITATANATFATVPVVISAISSISDARLPTWAFDTYGYYIWGAQLEAGAFATSYIPTVASQVTRSADNASMTGANFSSWYNQSEGTLYGEWGQYSITSPNNQWIAVVSDGTFNNYIGSLTNPSSYRALIVSGGIMQASIINGTVTANTATKFSLTYKVDDFAATSGGALPIADTSGVVPIVSQLTIGSVNNSNLLNGTIKRIAYYPKRLSNTELQGLTS